MFTIDYLQSAGVRAKVEIWDVDPGNADDKIDFYYHTFTRTPARNEASARPQRITMSSRQGYSA